MVKYTKISGAYITKYKTNFMNPQFLQLDIYRRVIRIINESKKDKQAIPSQIDNWLKAESVALKINQEKQKEKLYSFLPEINKLKYPLFKKVLLEKIRVLTSFNDGDTAKNFIGADSNNIQFHLTQFRGKIIYIDLWATWCGPCLQEMPFLDNLKERYKDNPGIVFLSFSIDDNQELWKKSLIKRKLTGLQLITSRGDLKEYNPIVIPRTIIIDKSFIISAMNGPLPSSENTTNLLDSLLKK